MSSCRVISPPGSAPCRLCWTHARATRCSPIRAASATASAASRRSTSGARRSPTARPRAANACRTIAGCRTTSRSWAAARRAKRTRRPPARPGCVARAVPDMATAVAFEAVTCAFGAVRAVDGVSFEIDEGEFFTLLGPSGSGKATCLRMIGGFQSPTSGRVLLHGRDASRLPPYERDVNTVFQDYALFPHMTVRDNVAYGLMVRGVPKAERYRRVGEMLEMMRLPEIGDRRPA